MTTNETAGPLQTALARITDIQRRQTGDDAPPVIRIVEELTDAMHEALTALIPASQLAIETRERVTSQDRDIGALTERLQGAERRLDALQGMTERDLRELAARDQLTAGKIDGLRETCLRTVRDLRGAERALGELHKQIADQATRAAGVVANGEGIALQTLHIEHLHIGDAAVDLHEPVTEREIEGAAIAADLMAAGARRRAVMDKPITPHLVSESSGEELEWIAERLGLARKDPPGGETEADEALRLRCGAALFAQHMTRESASALAAMAKEQRHPKRSPGPWWTPGDWVIDAVMAAAGMRQGIGMIWTEGSPTDLAARMSAEAEIGSKDRDELAQAHSDLNGLRIILAEITDACRADGIEVQRWRDLPEAIAVLRRDRDKARAELESKELFGEWRGKLRADFDAEIARLSKVHEASIAREHKRVADLQEQIRAIGVAYDRGVALWRQDGGNVRAMQLPATRTELVTWLLTQHEGWRARLAKVLNTAPDMHHIEAAVNRLAKRAEELDRTRSERSVTLDAQTAELEGLRRQLAELNAVLDARALAIKTAQEQLDKFMSACGDQAIQIMELRGERIRLLDAAASYDRANNVLQVLRGINWDSAWQASDVAELKDAYLTWIMREQVAADPTRADPTRGDHGDDEEFAPLSAL